MRKGGVQSLHSTHLSLQIGAVLIQTGSLSESSFGTTTGGSLPHPERKAPPVPQRIRKEMNISLCMFSFALFRFKVGFIALSAELGVGFKD